MIHSPWKALLVLALGTAAGALLRFGLAVVLIGNDDLASSRAIAVSMLGGGLLGGLLGRVVRPVGAAGARTPFVAIGLVAALGGLAATAIVGATLGAALAGLVVVLRLSRRSLPPRGPGVN